MKDPENCPLCEAEIYGESTGWGFSPEGWEEVKDNHYKNHTNELPEDLQFLHEV